MPKCIVAILLLSFSLSCFGWKHSSHETKFISTNYEKGSKEYNDKFVSFAYRSNNNFFVETTDHKFRIQNVQDTLTFEGTTYTFHKYSFAQEFDCCQYHFGVNDTYFLNTIFENGSKTHSLYFTCKWLKGCAGLECKWDWISAVVVLVVIIGIILTVITRKILGRWL